MSSGVDSTYKGAAHTVGDKDTKEDDKSLLGYRLPQPYIEHIDDDGRHVGLERRNNICEQVTLMIKNKWATDNPTDTLINISKNLYEYISSLEHVKHVSGRSYKSSWDYIKDMYLIKQKTYETPKFDISEGIKYWANIASDPDFDKLIDYGLINSDIAGPASWGTNFNYEELFTTAEYVNNNHAPSNNADIYGISNCTIASFIDEKVFCEQFSQIIKNVNDGGKLNPEWTCGNIFFKYKKGDTTDPENFRPIISQPMVVRIYHRSLARFMYKFMIKNGYLDNSIQKGMNGVGDSVFENTVHTRSMLSDAMKHSKNIYVASLDIKQAYGSIRFPLIRYCLKKYNFDDDLINYVMTYYNNMKVRFICDGKLSEEEFYWRKGLLQGDNLANVLFLICMNSVLSKMQNEYGALGFNIQENIKITPSCVDVIKSMTKMTDKLVTDVSKDIYRCLFLAYVDDILVFTNELDDLSVVVNMFNKYFNNIDLELNFEKTKWFVQKSSADSADSADSVDTVNIKIDVTVNEKSSLLDKFDDASATGISDDATDLYINDIKIYKLKDDETLTYLGSEFQTNGYENVTLKKYIDWLRKECEYIDNLTHDALFSHGTQRFINVKYKDNVRQLNNIKVTLYKKFVYRRTVWDFSRIMWSASAISEIVKVETEYLSKWNVGEYMIPYMTRTRNMKSSISREYRCLNASHSMMRTYALSYYRYIDRASAAVVLNRLERLKKMTDKITDEFNSTIICNYDEIEQL